MKFKFRWWSCIVDNRNWNYSTFTRSCQSATVELSIPFTDYHLLIDVTCSLLPYHARPDAWKATTDGCPVPEKLFPRVEWEPCPECGEDVVNKEMDTHLDVQHGDETARFPPFGDTKTDIKNKT